MPAPLTRFPHDLAPEAVDAGYGLDPGDVAVEVGGGGVVDRGCVGVLFGESVGRGGRAGEGEVLDDGVGGDGGEEEGGDGEVGGVAEGGRGGEGRMRGFWGPSGMVSAWAGLKRRMGGLPVRVGCGEFREWGGGGWLGHWVG